MTPKNFDELRELLKLLDSSSVIYYQSGEFVLNIGPKSFVQAPTSQLTGQADSPDEQYDVYDDPDLYGGRVPTSLKRTNGRPSEDSNE